MRTTYKINYGPNTVRVFTYTNRTDLKQAFKLGSKRSILGFYEPGPNLGSIHLLVPARLATIAHEVYHLVHAYHWGGEEAEAAAQGQLTQTIQTRLQ